jgi:hypothetical protein
MLSPMIPLEALLERATACGSRGCGSDAPACVADRGRRQFPQAEKSKDELQVFQ